MGWVQEQSLLHNNANSCSGIVYMLVMRGSQLVWLDGCTFTSYSGFNILIINVPCHLSSSHHWVLSTEHESTLQMTGWRWIFLEKPIVLHLVKDIASFWTLRFITAFSRAYHCSLSRASYGDIDVGTVWNRSCSIRCNALIYVRYSDGNGYSVLWEVQKENNINQCRVYRRNF
jgi:hypothetical protein